MAQVTFAQLQELLAPIAPAIVALEARLTALEAAPIAQPAPTPITQAPSAQARATAKPSPVKDPKALWITARNALRKARDNAKAEHGYNSPAHKIATLALLDAYDRGIAAGFYECPESMRVTLDTWRGLDPAQVSAPHGHAKIERRMPVPDPTADAGVAAATRAEKRVMKPAQLAALARGRATAAANRATRNAGIVPVEVAAESASARVLAEMDAKAAMRGIKPAQF